MAEVFEDVVRSGESVHFDDAEFVGLKNRPIVMPGDVTHWDWGISPLKDADGEVAHLVVTGYDVTAAARDRVQLDRIHTNGIRALLEVSRVVSETRSIEEAFGELSSTVARLVGAARVLFTRVDAGSMAVQPRTHGFDDATLVDLRVPCSPDGNDLADRIVYQDEVFNAAIDSGPELEPYREALESMGVSNAIAVSWGAGDTRLGLVAAFNSERRDGFLESEVHLLKTAGMAAGLVFHYRQSQLRLAEAQRAETDRLSWLATEMAVIERAKTDFLQLASHEMRNPISTASVYASMLAEGSMGAVSDQQREALSILRAKIVEISRMVDQILEVSRLEDPRLRLKLTTFDLRDCVASSVQKSTRDKMQGHLVTLDVGKETILVRADRERIEMVLANPIDNALKYSPDGGEVLATLRRIGAKAEMRITDHGVGIAQADIGKLFARFSRVGGVRTEGIPGTGLGLFLCQQVARLHGGEISVQSSAGEGSTFTLELPLNVGT